MPSSLNRAESSYNSIQSCWQARCCKDLLLLNKFAVILSVERLLSPLSSLVFLS